MRTADIDYDMGLSDGTKLLISILYEIELKIEQSGNGALVNINAIPSEISLMLGGMPFKSVKWKNVCDFYPLRNKINALASEVTIELIGITLEEAVQEAQEEEAEKKEFSGL